MRFQLRSTACAALTVILLLLAGCAGEKAPFSTGAPDDGENGSPLLSLSAMDLDGNPVDGSVFTAHRVTFVHRWATWCGPCVGEMEELASLIETCEDRDVGFLFMAEDGDTKAAEAREIMKDAGVAVVCIRDNSAINALFGHSYYPATQLVDAEGEPVGEGMIGTQGMEAYLAAIDAALGNELP